MPTSQKITTNGMWTPTLNRLMKLKMQSGSINQDQSGYESLNLENESFLNSDNFDATDLRF